MFIWRIYAPYDLFHMFLLVVSRKDNVMYTCCPVISLSLSRGFFPPVDYLIVNGMFDTYGDFPSAREPRDIRQERGI